jgi:hypothetical protein
MKTGATDMNAFADRSHPAVGASVWSIGLIIAGSALLASLIEPHYVKTDGVTRPAVQHEQPAMPVRTAIDRRVARATSTR